VKAGEGPYRRLTESDVEIGCFRFAPRNNQLELWRTLDRRLRRFFAVEYAINIIGCPSEQITQANPVGDKAALPRVSPPRVNRGDSVATGQFDDFPDMRGDRRRQRDDPLPGSAASAVMAFSISSRSWTGAN